MSNPTEHAPPALLIEEALQTRTKERFNPEDATWYRGVAYPRHLGSLAVDRLNLEPYSDVPLVVRAVGDDFEASYKLDNPEAANDMRQRSMAWLDWLSQHTTLSTSSSAYVELATVAARHGDAATVRQIIEEPKRLWLEKPMSCEGIHDPDFGRLDRQSIETLSGCVADVAGLMTSAPHENAQHMQEAVMPTLQNIVAELANRDLTGRGYMIPWVGGELMEIGTSVALEQLNILVNAMPMTPARVDVLAKLAESDVRFAAAAGKARAWYEDKTSLAQSVLADFMKPQMSGRHMIVNYLEPQSGPGLPEESRIANAIVDHIPTDGSETSAIETSAAYAIFSLHGGSVHGNILQCVRALTGNPHFELANPQFGFAATLNGYDDTSETHARITVSDSNLPAGRLVIDLSDEQFKGKGAYDKTRLLCSTIQRAKDRRAA